MTEPRIPPVPRENWGEAEKQVFGHFVGRDQWEISTGSNLMKTLANHPPLATAYLTFGYYLIQNARLPDRPRELLTLRIAILCGTPYEWHNHIAPAKAAGISDAEIEAIRLGVDRPDWPEADRALLDAIDQLFARHQIEEPTWAILADAYDRQQLMDLVFTIGHYAMSSWAMNVFGIEPDTATDDMVEHFLRRRDRERAADTLPNVLPG